MQTTSIRLKRRFRNGLSGTQLVKQRLGLLEVGSGEALGESAVDGCEEVGSLLSFTALGQHRCQVSSGTQLERRCLLLPRDVQRAAEVRLGGVALARSAAKRQYRPHAMKLGGESHVAAMSEAVNALPMLARASSCRPARA